MKVEAFEILFDDAAQNPQLIYRPGQLVYVRLHVRLLQPIKCRAIYVTLFGSSKVHWTETKTRGSGKSKRTYTKHYDSEEIYIDQNVAVYTPPREGPLEDHHPAGDYFYSVAFQIPPTAPSSFEGGVGAIRYGVRANIDRPWRFDKTTQVLYTVIRDLDLNMLPESDTGPFTSNRDFDVDCCYCFNCCYGRVRVQIDLPKKGYVPGEMVHVTGELHNSSSTNLKSGCFEINQRIVFHASGSTKTINRVTSTVELEGAQRGRSIAIDSRLPVNPLPPRLEGCTNIYVQYFLRLYADGGCCVAVSEDCCELVIGTQPMRSALDLGTPSAPPYYAPPSYEQCMFGRQDVTTSNADASDELRRAQGSAKGQLWAPSYPVYSGLTPVS